MIQNPFELDWNDPETKYPEPTREQIDRYKKRLLHVSLDDMIASCKAGFGPGHPEQFESIFRMAWEELVSEGNLPEMKSVYTSGFGETVDRIADGHQMKFKEAKIERKTIKKCSELWKKLDYKQRLKFVAEFHQKRKRNVTYYYMLMDIIHPGWSIRSEREGYDTDYQERDIDYERSMRYVPETSESLASFNINYNFDMQDEGTTKEEYRQRVKKAMEELKSNRNEKSRDS